MELYYLREFIALSSLKSFSKVAEELNTTVSSASRHVQSMENELGVQLVERNTRGVELTKYGETLLPYAKRIVENYNNCNMKLASMKQKNNNVLRIGSAAGPAPELLSGFFLQHKDVILDYTTHAETTLLDSLDIGEIELAISPRDIIPNEGFVIIPYVTLTYYVTVPSKSPLAQKENIALWDITDELIILESDNSLPPERVITIFKRNHFEPKSIMQVGRGARSFISNNVGVTISANEKAMDEFVNPNIKMIPLAPAISLEICVVYKKGKRLSPNAKCFLDFLIKEWPEH